jgi:proteasome lid subunit RPN8/RPN11
MEPRIYTPNDTIPDDVQFAYIHAEGGNYLMKRNMLFEAVVKVDEVPGLPPQKQYLQLMTNKIPAELFKQIQAFLKAVYDEHKSEGMVLLTYDQEVGWGINIPEQEVTAAHIDYKNTDNVRAVGTVHSHPKFGRTPSGTDEHDEMTFDGIHLIVNDWKFSDEFITAFAVCNGVRFSCQPSLIIDGLPERVDVEFPKEWMARVKKKSYQSRHTPTGFQGRGSSPGGGRPSGGSSEKKPTGAKA